ncbi:MAG: hypothetical protein Q9217_005759 [Psora testacea]
MTQAQFSAYQKHLYFDVIVAHIAIGTIKVSVISFYKRVFATAKFHRYANGTMAIAILWTLGATIVSDGPYEAANRRPAHPPQTQIFSAWPISDWWTKQAGYDLNYGGFITAFAAVDIALDIVAAAVRLYFAYELSKGASTHPTDNRFSYVSVNSVIWSLIEPCVSIVAACLPTLGPLVKSKTSLRSLARSLQSHILRRSKSGVTSSEDSSHVSNGRQSDLTANSKPQGPWSPLPDAHYKTTPKDDIELAISHPEWGTNSAQRVHVGRAEDSQTRTEPSDTRQIYVESSFASKLEAL